MNDAPPVLKLLSYNIQVGIAVTGIRDYILGSWRHVLPDKERQKNLDTIARLAKTFDLVALQEVDGGSLRTNYINQVHYLAMRAGFPFWHSQCNRNLGKFAQHSNGVLSHYRPTEISDHKLPGALPGRGAIILRFGNQENNLLVVVLHLALGKTSRNQQLAYIAKEIQNEKNVIVLGDLNCSIDALWESPILKETDLRLANTTLDTFPSWAPKKILDHILVSRSLSIRRVDVLPHSVSDHLPVSVDIELSDALREALWIS